MTRDEFQSFCEDICPRCKRGVPLRWRGDTSEWVHDEISRPSESTAQLKHSFCFASHFRNKWKDTLDGQ